MKLSGPSAHCAAVILSATTVPALAANEGRGIGYAAANFTPGSETGVLFFVAPDAASPGEQK